MSLASFPYIPRRCRYSEQYVSIQNSYKDLLCSIVMLLTLAALGILSTIILVAFLILAKTARSDSRSDIRSSIRKRFLQIVVVILIQGVILFISSGMLDWVMAWVYIGVYVVGVIINAFVLLSKSPELIAERAQIKEGAKEWDRPLAGIVSFYGPVITLVVAGLDVRFGWSPPLALVVHGGALVFLVVGNILVSWAMVSNRFFSGLVRIQKERGHTVATGGPYQYIRHPGYTGMCMFSIATPLLLGSLWALIPAVFTIVVCVIRTAHEDKTLQEELDGYTEYAQHVRYRLLPGIW